MESPDPERRRYASLHVAVSSFHLTPAPTPARGSQSAHRIAHSCKRCVFRYTNKIEKQHVSIKFSVATNNFSPSLEIFAARPSQFCLLTKHCCGLHKSKKSRAGGTFMSFVDTLSHNWNQLESWVLESFNALNSLKYS